MTIDEALVLITDKVNQVLSANPQFSWFTLENGTWNFELRDDLSTLNTFFPAGYKVGEWDYSCRYEFREALSTVFNLLQEWTPLFKEANYTIRTQV